MEEEGEGAELDWCGGEEAVAELVRSLGGFAFDMDVFDIDEQITDGAQED